MRHQPADEMFPRTVRQHEKRLLRCHILNDVVCILDQGLAIVLTRRLELVPWRMTRSLRRNGRLSSWKSRFGTISTTGVAQSLARF